MRMLTTFILIFGMSASAQAEKKAAPKKAPIKKATLSKPVAAKPAASKPAAKPAAKVAAPRSVSKPPSSQSQKNLGEALANIKNGNLQQAAGQLFLLSKRPDLAEERAQIKYILGNTLLELKLFQIAAFQYVDVIRSRSPRYTKLAIEKLSLAADQLGDDTLLNYAISKVQIEDFPAAYKDLVYFRLGEIKQKNGRFAEALDLFSKVSSKSRYYVRAKYNRGLSYLEGGRLKESLSAFEDLKKYLSNAPVTDTNKVATQLALARTLYQLQNWDGSIEAYRDIPRDSIMWHDALFESSWAMLRAAKFRSALSNFQSLHSAYYDDFYIPESLLLRAIVYLYICKYDEMDKVLNLFEKTYGPIRSSMLSFSKENKDPLLYYAEVEKAYNISRDKKTNAGMRIPYSVAKNILDEGNVKRAFNYLKTLADEKGRLDQMPFSKSSLGHYGSKILMNRGRNTKVAIGEMVKVHMANLKAELLDFYEQASFIRYEMINGKKEQIRKKMGGKSLPTQIDESNDRTYYVQNGYEYWPFDGEYWLDEIGNYHYLGQQSCE